ncbi:MAG: hypothetical protein KUA43_06165 [Hoeflea sp.]|uniref:hypothetical protein n=1 Tax=Hoeflea sp. TaxID=1940281 RepID=UPI001D75B2DC|nr:hypothetical protein [Hoeflea sp.]MBU4530207.1 hypothetical protein [Alphaproteobacteria bacterium]MBU4542508.1 hypothetical protein [Alphaproteobacteria bacterium]MBU4551189.1 hypothetical protein [Alphaproteobacteria bacterium]MBV1723012.1 hypothetical protein [Hoeflea sp.]MBV1760023.1 hypothetical protein [Hoeflea sp.]
MSRLKTRILVMLAPFALAGCVSEPQSPPSPRMPVVNLDAVLPPESLLREDTLTALSHDRNASRLAYVGVWATDGDRCAMMDQTDFEGFAVITPDSIRQSSGTCTFAQPAPGETSVLLNATCKAGGNRTVSIQMLNSQTMHLSTAPGQPGAQMVRCRLQK